MDNTFKYKNNLNYVEHFFNVSMMAFLMENTTDTEEESSA